MSPASSPRHIDMPGWRPIVRQVLTRIVLVSVLPMAAFYVTLSMYGVRAAALVTAGLYYVGLLGRVVLRKPILAAMLLAAGLLTLRTVIVFWTGSAFIYFLQPVLGTVAVATAFAASMLAGRPILEKLAHEFCPLSPELSDHLRSGQFYGWLSLVWTVCYGVNAAGTVWVLTSASMGGFIVIKSVLGPALTSMAILASYVIFVRVTRGRNVRIRWANHQGWSHAPA